MFKGEDRKIELLEKSIHHLWQDNGELKKRISELEDMIRTRQETDVKITTKKARCASDITKVTHYIEVTTDSLESFLGNGGIIT